MSDNLNNGTASSGVAPQSTPTSQPAPVTPQGTAQSASTGTATAQPIKLKVNGSEREFTYDDLIVHAQKGLAADEKFREAAALRDKATSLEQAFNSLQSMVASKDRAGLEKIFGKDIFGVVNQAPQYDDTDVRMAQTLGLDVESFIEAKRKASGLDNPLVAQQQQKISQLEQTLKSVLDEVKSVKQHSKTSEVERVFEGIASKYPKADKVKVLDLMINKGLDISQAESVFQTLHNERMSEFEEYYKQKIKEAQNNSQALNINQGGSTLNSDQFAGKNLEEKSALLKAMFGGE